MFGLLFAFKKRKRIFLFKTNNNPSNNPVPKGLLILAFGPLSAGYCRVAYVFCACVMILGFWLKPALAFQNESADVCRRNLVQNKALGRLNGLRR